MTDTVLNNLFAEHVAKWKTPDGSHVNDLIGFPMPDYAGDANAVLPFLYKCHWEVQQTSNAARPIRVVLGELHGPFGEADNFPRAAVLALLRDKGIAV